MYRHNMFGVRINDAACRALKFSTVIHTIQFLTWYHWEGFCLCWWCLWIFHSISTIILEKHRYGIDNREFSLPVILSIESEILGLFLSYSALFTCSCTLKSQHRASIRKDHAAFAPENIGSSSSNTIYGAWTLICFLFQSWIFTLLPL